MSEPLRRGARRPRLAWLAAAAAAAALLGAAAAEAHEGRHDFESVLSGIVPPRLAAGIEVRMIDYDSQVELVNRSGRAVVVIGYEGEPYARLDPAGQVYLSVRSPSLPLSNDRLGRTPPSGTEDARAPPRWVRVGDDGALRWFDRRTHYRGSGTPPGVEDPTSRRRLWSYRIPLRVGGEPAAIRGTLYWVGRRPFPTPAFLAVLLATAAAALFGAWALKRLRAPDPPSRASRASLTR